MARIGMQERDYLRHRIRETAAERTRIFKHEYQKATDEILESSGVNLIIEKAEAAISDFNKELHLLIGIKPLSFGNELGKYGRPIQPDSKVGKLIAKRVENWKLREAKIQDLTRDFEDRVMFADLPSSLATVLADFQKALEEL